MNDPQKIITVSMQDLRDVIAAAFGRGCNFWNMYRPKNLEDFKDKMTREKLATIEDFIKFILTQEQFRDAQKKGEA